MATIIEIQENKLQNLTECAEKVLKYGGKLMQCLEDLESKSRYNEYAGYERKRYDKEPWEDTRHLSRYY